MIWSLMTARWLGRNTRVSAPVADDAVGDTVRAAVREHTRVKADSTRCYEVRMQTMIDELFLRMGESRVRHDS